MHLRTYTSSRAAGPVALLTALTTLSCGDTGGGNQMQPLGPTATPSLTDTSSGGPSASAPATVTPTVTDTNPGGPPGATGPTGAMGPTGATGPTGPVVPTTTMPTSPGGVGGAPVTPGPMGAGGSGGDPGAGGSAGGAGGNQNDGPPPTFETLITVLNFGCYGAICHDLPENPLFLDKTDLDSIHATLMTHTVMKCAGAPAINLDSPADSALIRVLREGCGEIPRMPLGCMPGETPEENTACIPDEYTEAIRQWIELGAPL